MKGSFFADYKKYIVIPQEEQKVSEKAFDPQEYASHFILTLSIYEPVVCNQIEARKHEIDVEKSIERVLTNFNQKHRGAYLLQLLELEDDKPYFVLALSSEKRIEKAEAESQLTDIIEKLITNPFYIGQGWYKLISEKGRVERKLFCFSYKEYTYEDSN